MQDEVTMNAIAMTPFSWLLRARSAGACDWRKIGVQAPREWTDLRRGGVHLILGACSLVSGQGGVLESALFVIVV
jgi:hypothetical protein